MKRRVALCFSLSILYSNEKALRASDGMATFLQKRWFLLLILIGVGAAWARPGLLHWTAYVDPRMVVASALFLAACGLESRSLYRSLLRPLPALWAVAISYGVVPACAWLVGPLLPGEDYRIGLLISASVPCTLASAVLWTRMARGNEATALLAILLSTATSWLATTAWLTAAVGQDIQVDSAAMMRGLFLVLVLPVALGQLGRVFAPFARATTRHKVFLGVLARLFILLIILKAAVDVLHRLGEREALAPAALISTASFCVGLHLTALGIGLYGSRLLGFDRPNQRAVAFACSQKTLPVALYLFDVYFKAYPLAVAPMVFYHVGQLVVDTFIAEELAARVEEATPSVATSEEKPGERRT